MRPTRYSAPKVGALAVSILLGTLTTYALWLPFTSQGLTAAQDADGDQVADERQVLRSVPTPFLSAAAGAVVIVLSYYGMRALARRRGAWND